MDVLITRDMSYQVLARKVAPAQFRHPGRAGSCGQGADPRAFQNASTTPICSPGPVASGKTTMARILAKIAELRDRRDADALWRLFGVPEIDGGRFVDLLESMPPTKAMRCGSCSKTLCTRRPAAGSRST